MPGVLSNLLNQYLTSQGYELNNCIANSLQSTWYADLQIDGISVSKYEFFEGQGFNVPPYSSPTEQQWLDALVIALDGLDIYGYSYYLTEDNKVVVFNEVCSVSEVDVNFKLNIGINFEILCNQ